MIDFNFSDNEFNYRILFTEHTIYIKSYAKIDKSTAYQRFDIMDNKIRWVWKNYADNGLILTDALEKHCQKLLDMKAYW